MREKLHNLLTDLKHPQFSLRLMLLMVALLGAIIGWRTTVYQIRVLDCEYKRTNIEAEIATLERLFRDAPSWKPIHGPRLAAAKKELENLSP